MTDDDLTPPAAAALSALLRPELPAAPSAAETEQALATVMARRDTVPVPLAARDTERRSAARIVGWAATVGVAAALLIVVGRDARRDARPDRADTPTLAARSTRVALETGVGRVDSLRLPDGTRIVLGPASAVDVADGYTAGRREVALRGEAFFDVVHDDAHPFVVRTRQGTVRDVGTRFVVSTDRVTGTVVSVRSGTVDVRGVSEHAPAARVGASDRARLTDSGALSVQRGVVTDDDLAWMRGRLVLHEASLADVTAALHRWYGIELRVADSALATRRVTVTFGSESGADAGRVVAAVMGGIARVSGDTVYVSARGAARP